MAGAIFHRPLQSGLIVAALVAVAGLAGVVGLALGGQPAGGKDEIYARVRASGKLRVCLDASFPPFEYIGNDGRVVGFDPDLAGEVARRLGLGVEFVNTAFDSLYTELDAGHCEAIMSALPYDKLRTRDVAYSDIYFRGGEVLIVQAGDTLTLRPSDLSGRTVGVELGTAAEALALRLSRRNGFQLLSLNTNEDAAIALERHQIGALIADAVSARLLIRSHAGLRITGEPLGSEPNYVAAVPVDAQALLAAINGQLRAMGQDHTLTRLTNLWF